LFALKVKKKMHGAARFGFFRVAARALSPKRIPRELNLDRRILSYVQ